MNEKLRPFFSTKPTNHADLSLFIRWTSGLSLSYDIVKTNCEELRVETKEGVQSIFIIQLPA